MEQKTEASQAVDERALFERNLLDNASDKEGAKLLLSFRHENGKYGAPWLNDQLWGWQARAALKAQPAPTEAQGEAVHQVFDTTCNAWDDVSKVQYDRCNPDHRRILYTSPQPSGNTGELAQGEDSARLDWLLQNPHITVSYSGAADFQWIFSNSISGKSSPCHLSGRDAIDRARASAETGGVKP